MIRKIFVLSLVLLLVVGCSQEVAVEPKKEPAEIQPDPETKEEADLQEELPEEEVLETDPKIQELLTKGAQVKSIYYKYKGPKTDNKYYDFYVKGDIARYVPDYNTNFDLETFYNAVYLDYAKKTAESYCDDRRCKPKGKRNDLDFGEANMFTPYDWLTQIKYAEKAGEEIIGKRNTWKLSTNDGKIVWIDTFYGVPQQVSKDGNLYEFTQMTFNNVKDEDIRPLS